MFKVSVCVTLYGVSVPSLHRESTDSLIETIWCMCNDLYMEADCTAHSVHVTVFLQLNINTKPRSWHIAQPLYSDVSTECLVAIFGGNVHIDRMWGDRTDAADLKILRFGKAHEREWCFQLRLCKEVWGLIWLAVLLCYAYSNDQVEQSKPRNETILYAQHSIAGRYNCSIAQHSTVWQHC